MLLALVELGLRVGGYGDYPLFIADDQHPRYLRTNPDMAKRYFGAGPFTPTPEVEFLRADKAPRAFRIVFQGESSAQGFPYGHGAMPSRMLEQRLQATFPDREIEVINTALTGINSYSLLDQTRDIIAQHPDAVLIYTGHNEYYGVFGVGSARGFGQSRLLVRAYLALTRLRTIQLLANAISLLTARPSSGAPRTVMELMAREQHIALGSPRYEEGLDQFRANIGELMSRYQARKIPVLIGTLASNERDQPPLASADPSGADSADVEFALAHRLEAGGDTSGARAAYRDAKERDPLRFRAPEAINRIIREEAARRGSIVVETQRAIEKASPGGIPGKSLLLEHVHPSLDGYFLIADAFYEAMHANQMIDDWSDAVPAPQARREIAVTPIDSLVGLLRTDRLMSGWPFRRRGDERTPTVDTLHPRTAPEQLAQAVVLGTLPWPEATERLRDQAERAGDYELASRAAFAMAQEYSYSSEPLLDLAELALRRNNAADALRYARTAMTREETPRGVRLLGQLLIARGEQTAAMPFLQRAAEQSPNDRRVVARFRAAGALPDLEARHAQAPRDPNALYNLAVAYALTDQKNRARAIVTTLRRIAPRHAGAIELQKSLSQ